MTDVAGATRSAGRTATADPGLPAQVTAGFAALHLLLVMVGRSTVIEGASLSLFWPAEGVAVLWLLAESSRRQPRVLAYLAAELVAVSYLTGASTPLIGFGVASVLVQTWLIVWLLRRWCPTLLGAGGSRSVHEPRVLLRATLIVLGSCLLGASIGMLGLWTSGAATSPEQLLLWWGRQVAGTMTVGSVGHLAWEWWRSPAPPRAHGGTRRELAALWVSAVAVTVVVFTQPLPVMFALVPFSVWCGVRFSTFVAVLQTVCTGAIALALTIAGYGPFVELDDPYRSAMVTQAYILVLLLTSLAVGTVSDRIDDLVTRLRDSSRRTAAQAELLDSVTQSMEEGLVVLDGSGRVVVSNAAVRRMALELGGDADDLDGLLDRLATDQGTAVAREHRPELGPGDVVVDTGGGEMILAVTSGDLAHGADGFGDGGTVMVVHEVTGHRHGLRPLAQFASTAAHDLRGPLTAMSMWLAMIGEAPPVQSDPELSEPLSRVDRCVLQMARMIESLLARATAEEGILSPEDVPLDGVDGVVEAVRELLGLDAELVVHSPLPPVHADRGAVQQVIANLVGNGLKYARDDVPPRIEVSAATEGDRVVVLVSDNGIGVPEGEREKIFVRFTRSENVPDEVRGSGIGLALCRTLVERHGGRIEHLPSADGPGSVFRFDLPAAELAVSSSGAGPR